LSWTLYGWPSWSLLFCYNPLDMTRYRCFSGVRFPDQGPQRKRMVAPLRDNEDLSASQPSIFTLSFTGLDPDGCLVADRIRIRTNKFWKPGCRQRQGTDLILDDVPAKKRSFFCDGEVFFLDRGLLMGAINTTCSRFMLITDILP
jgi:hypothetical protein